jgi:hypothetical protein
MAILVRAVITGFGMALGAALFKKAARQLGLDDAAEPPAPAKTPMEPVAEQSVPG